MLKTVCACKLPVLSSIVICYWGLLRGKSLEDVFWIRIGFSWTEDIWWVLLSSKRTYHGIDFLQSQVWCAAGKQPEGLGTLPQPRPPLASWAAIIENKKLNVRIKYSFLVMYNTSSVFVALGWNVGCVFTTFCSLHIGLSLLHLIFCYALWPLSHGRPSSPLAKNNCGATELDHVPNPLVLCLTTSINVIEVCGTHCRSTNVAMCQMDGQSSTLMCLRSQKRLQAFLKDVFFKENFFFPCSFLAPWHNKVMHHQDETEWILYQWVQGMDLEGVETLNSYFAAKSIFFFEKVPMSMIRSFLVFPTKSYDSCFSQSYQRSSDFDTYWNFNYFVKKFGVDQE